MGQQVITNLLGNSVKFSSKGKEIQIRGEVLQGNGLGETPEWIRISVSDQGIGIEEKDYDSIFDKFCQLSTDTLKDKPKGTGLGLPICKEIVGHSMLYAHLKQKVNFQKYIQLTHIWNVLKPTEPFHTSDPNICGALCSQHLSNTQVLRLPCICLARKHVPRGNPHLRDIRVQVL